MKAPAQTWPDVDALPLEKIDVADPRLYQEDRWPPYFARLRREAPVHYCPGSAYGPYWSVTKFKDIMHVEVNHEVYSSAAELGGIQVEDQPKDMDRPSFIAWTRRGTPSSPTRRTGSGPTRWHGRPGAARGAGSGC